MLWPCLIRMSNSYSCLWSFVSMYNNLQVYSICLCRVWRHHTCWMNWPPYRDLIPFQLKMWIDERALELIYLLTWLFLDILEDLITAGSICLKAIPGCLSQSNYTSRRLVEFTNSEGNIHPKGLYFLFHFNSSDSKACFCLENEFDSEVAEASIAL